MNPYDEKVAARARNNQTACPSHVYNPEERITYRRGPSFATVAIWTVFVVMFVIAPAAYFLAR